MSLLPHYWLLVCWLTFFSFSPSVLSHTLSETEDSLLCCRLQIWKSAINYMFMPSSFCFFLCISALLPVYFSQTAVHVWYLAPLTLRARSVQAVSCRQNIKSTAATSLQHCPQWFCSITLHLSSDLYTAYIFATSLAKYHKFSVSHEKCCPLVLLSVPENVLYYWTHS